MKYVADEQPNEKFPGRVPSELCLSAILAILVAINIIVIVKLQVYKQMNSMTIMVALTLLQVIRMITYIWRVVENDWSVNTWVWYRVTTDWTNFLLGVISLVLIV